MHNSESPDNSEEKNKQAEKLRDLLCAQVGHYQEAERLEAELAELIKTGDLPKVADNTKRKAALMEQISRTEEEILDLAQPLLAADGSFSDPEIEKLRLKSMELLERLMGQEVENRAGLEGFRDAMMKNFRETKQAKRVAHGYKQSKSIYRSKHDTRR